MEKGNVEEALKEEETVKSGVNGLDDLFGGGFDPGSVILLSGPPGSGKSVMSAQFIYNGAVKYGEAGLYVNFSESRGDFMRNMARFRMDFNRLEEEGLFRFIDAYNVFNRRSLDLILSHVLDELASLRVRRMVLDSVNSVAAMMDKDELRGFIAATILGICKVNKVTCILISNQLKEVADVKLAELAFMCDTVINLEAKLIGDTVERFLIINKARGKNPIASRAEYIITDRGVEVFAPIVRLPAERGRLDGYVGIGHPEFDEKVLMGGVRRGTVTLISGPGGTGKRFLLVEFAASSVLRGEKTLYATFRDLRRVEESFINRGYDVKELEKRGMRFVEFSPFRVTPGIILLTLKETLDDFQPSMAAVEEVASLKWLPREDYYRLINKMAALFKD
ncbi:MAG: ATPase domain-containing protein, partial [Candidatus Jordarchaeales archaeon]